MASVDVGVALLGYGTVGASVNRLLVESADEIERATGHRLRIVRALVRDADKSRSFAANRRRDHDRLRRSARRPLDSRRRGGDGRARPGRRIRPRVAPRRQVGGDREQAARRPRGRRPVRDRVGGRRAAAVRGFRLRGDPRREGAARVARRLERASRARDRQRHDELHPLAHGAGRLLCRGARRGAGARLRRGGSDRRRERRRRRREDGDPRDGRVRLAGRARGRRHARASPRSSRRTSRRPPISAWSCGSSASRASSTTRSTCACSPRSSSGRIRSPRSTARSTP